MSDRRNWRIILGLLAVLLLAGDIWLGFALGRPVIAALLIGLSGWVAAFYFWNFPRDLMRDGSRDLPARGEPAAAPLEAQPSGRAGEEISAILPLQDRLMEAEQKRAEERARLRALFQVNRAITDAAAGQLDERGLMDAVLCTVTELVGALGCSFVPVDEWQEPLPPFTYGTLPAPVLSAWSTHLADNMLRERCGACAVLHSTAGACPLHPAQVGDALTVFCLPMAQPDGSGRPVQVDQSIRHPVSGMHLGVLHLYLPPGRALDEDTGAFLADLLPELALAYQAARLRSQEMVTMRQLQMLHAPESDFTTSLNSLLEGLAKALEADFALIRLRPSMDERLAALNAQQGSPEGLPEETAETLFSMALQSVLRGEPAASAPSAMPAWLALPLLLPEAPEGGESRVLGMLLAGANRPYTFHPRQQAILQTIAAQAALLVENERLIRSLEYKVVIQERARLAREIHDGLAQTLAYLKLQAAQMQAYLAQGDTARLAQILKDNYQALAEAYLDTRQAIDNLRLTPQEGLERWLERTLREFENTAGLRVQRDLDPPARSLSPEVQAHLIRIVQEALSNVRKHARASHVRVSLRERPAELILEVSDDGLGFDAQDVPEISRHGLRGMRERAEMIGADFQIISQWQGGTTVRLVLPLWFEEEPS